MSLRLDRVIKAIDKLVKVYNTIDSPEPYVHTTQQKQLPLLVRHEDVTNQLWSAVDEIEHVVSTQHITSMQRKAIDLWNLKCHCEEEKDNVQNDMNVLFHIVNRK